jgi:hypothetical protein
MNIKKKKQKENQMRKDKDQESGDNQQESVFSSVFQPHKTIVPINKQYDKKNFTVGFLTYKTGTL